MGGRVRARVKGQAHIMMRLERESVCVCEGGRREREGKEWRGSVKDWSTQRDIDTPARKLTRVHGQRLVCSRDDLS